MEKKLTLNKISIKTLISGFILHIILSTIHLWTTVARYFYSYLIELNSLKFKESYLEFLFRLAIVFHSIFIPIGIVLNGNISSVKITSIGLLMKILSNAILIFIPNIIIVTITFLISSAGTGLAYFPVILEIWKYYPENKGLCTSFILSGFGFIRLIYKYISIKMINPNKLKIDLTTETYPQEINDNFKNYLKKIEIFFSVLSLLCVLLMFPYDEYNNILLFKKRKKNKKSQKYSLVELTNKSHKNLKFYYKNEDEKKEKKFFSAKILKLTNFRHEESSSSSYLKNLTKNLVENSEKKITKHFKEDENTQIPNKKITNKKDNIDPNLTEPLFSSLISQPYLQLTFIFFFAMIFSTIEISSMKKFGELNEYSENFLWYSSLLWKITNLFFYPIWGYLLDKIKFKKLYTIILSIEILISSSCYFIADNKFGFLLYSTVSSAVHTANVSLSPTVYSFIFDNEKGSLLFGISFILFNTFYIYRPAINATSQKIYYLLFYLVILLFNMLSLIILCFFDEKKYNYTGESDDGSEKSVKDSNSNSNDDEIELENIDFFDNEKKESESDDDEDDYNNNN